MRLDRSMGLKAALTLLSGLAVTAALGLAPARAQVPEVRLVRQFSMGYLQFNVMEREGLIEKHAKALGIPEVKVSWLIISGPAAVNDGLLSGQLDIAAGGVPGLVTLWAKTRNTPLAVKGISAFSSQPILLNTREERIKAITDYTPNDKIALPSVKVSIQAIILQMAAAKQWGKADFARLDPLTVAMTPPDATVALMAGSAGIGSAFTVPPFQTQQLETPGVRTVLNSFDVFGGPHSLTVAWTTSQFRDKNPVLYKAVYNAMAEATERVNKDLAAACQYWIDGNKSKLPLAKVLQVAKGEQVRWTMVPEHTRDFTEFMHSVGSIKEKAADWKELFFPEAHGMQGS